MSSPASHERAHSSNAAQLLPSTRASTHTDVSTPGRLADKQCTARTADMVLMDPHVASQALSASHSSAPLHDGPDPLSTPGLHPYARVTPRGTSVTIVGTSVALRCRAACALTPPRTSHSSTGTTGAATLAGDAATHARAPSRRLRRLSLWCRLVAPSPRRPAIQHKQASSHAQRCAHVSDRPNRAGRHSVRSHRYIYQIRDTSATALISPALAHLSHHMSPSARFHLATPLLSPPPLSFLPLMRVSRGCPEGSPSGRRRHVAARTPHSLWQPSYSISLARRQPP